MKDKTCFSPGMWKTAFLLVASLQLVYAGLRVLTVGDFGDNAQSGIINQERVAQVMSDWCGMDRCNFIVSAADNFYQSGVTSVDDPRFNTSWRWVYDKPNIASSQWFMSLGNHDYGTIDDRELNQVEFFKTEPRWYLPWLWYDFVYLAAGDISVHFIIVDAMSILLRRYDWEGELVWFEDVLRRSTSDWKVVIEHYPPYSAGNYGPGSLVHRNALVSIAEQYGLDFFIAGHDHNLQHIAKRDPNHDIDYIITGGGGRGLYAFDPRANSTLSELGFDVKYFGFHHGFVMLDFDKTSVQADFVNVDGTISYAFTRTK
jgi:hypothetical protein